MSRDIRPVITGVKGEDSGFSVKFPNGIEGEPMLVFNGLEIDADGESLIYGSLMAASNWLSDHCNELKSRQQLDISLSMERITDERGITNGSITAMKGVIEHDSEV